MVEGGVPACDSLEPGRRLARGCQLALVYLQLYPLREIVSLYERGMSEDKCESKDAASVSRTSTGGFNTQNKGLPRAIIIDTDVLLSHRSAMSMRACRCGDGYRPDWLALLGPAWMMKPRDIGNLLLPIDMVNMI